MCLFYHLFIIFLRSIDFYPNKYEYKIIIIIILYMINSTYLYSFLTLSAICSVIYFFFNFRSTKNQISNKIILKNLLESLDMDLPDELKALDNSSTDPQEF